MNFAANLKFLRINKGLSQKELAGRLEVSPSSITMYENGQREPNFTLLDKMATFFEVTTDHLLGRNTVLENQSDVEELMIMLKRIIDMQDELENMKYNIKSKLQSN